MNRRFVRALAIAAAALMLLSACGKEGTEEVLDVEGIEDANASVTPAASADASGSAAPDATAAPGASAAPAATAAGGNTSSGGNTATQPPAGKADSGGVNQPKAGTYKYNVKGKADDPFNPAAPPEDYSGEVVSKISNGGTVTTREDTGSNQAGRFTLRTRYESAQVVLLYFKAETQGGDFSCDLNPPLVVTKIPVKPEKFPTQTMKGNGNACGGKLDIEVLAKETAKDATGKSWTAWKVKVRQETKLPQGSLISDETRWVAPELGIEVRSQGTSTGKFGTSSFSSTASSALKSHP